jgi:hypothetical protein
LYYAPDAGIIHVHNESFSQIYRRYEREALAMRAIYPHETFTFFDFIKLCTLNTLSDYIHAAQDAVFIKKFFEIPAMRFYQFLGTYRGYNFRRPVQDDLRYKFYYPAKPALFNNKNGTKAQFHEKIFDISMPLTSDTPVWPTSEKFRVTWVKNLETTG